MESGEPSSVALLAAVDEENSGGNVSDGVGVAITPVGSVCTGTGIDFRVEDRSGLVAASVGRD
jgi:hypothetical protein